MSACEANPTVLQKITQQYNVTGFPEVAAALKADRFDGVVVCTPANTHISVALHCYRTEAALLVEKPLCTKLEEVAELKQEMAQRKQYLRVAFVYHFQPGIKAVREELRKGAFGRPLHTASVVGQHFPTFRPAYRQIYYTRHETGGGCIQDMFPHLVNSVEWLVGPTTRIHCEAGHQMLEGVTVEDTLSAAARHGDLLASYSLNQFQAPNEATFLVHCERGSYKVELHEQRWGAYAHGAAAWDYHPAPVKDRDDLFVAQANAFLDGMEGKETELATLEEAEQTLRTTLGALQSWRTGKPVETAVK